MHTRLPDWPTRLEAFFADARTRPYALGTWDCAIFCAEGVRAVTGALPIRLLGHYRSPLGMAKERALWGHSLREAVSTVLRRQPEPVRLAGRGDVLLRVDETGLEHLALCAGPFGVAPAEAGLFRRPLSDFTACWRVGA